MNVCVFASSSNNLAESFYDAASELGTLLGQNGINIVYGGSRLGMMYACAGKVKANGGKIIGVMPEKLYNLGVGNPDDCDEFYLTSGMRERKAKMDEVSDGVIALAGGFGTLEELSEMIVQKQLGYNKKPIILLNTNGYYTSLADFFETMIKDGFAKENARELYYIAQTPKEAVNYLLSYKSENLNYAGKF
ncbi:TIGR00730 family Rossman fold protein [bacterium]|nr:TIGR00730 family Rossman fold protein [bacterium]